MLGDRQSDHFATVPTMPRWIPNFITCLRIVLIPVFVLVAFPTAAIGAPETLARRLGALAVLLAIGGSDLLDGYLARRHGLVSRVGIILDAVADKLAQLSLGAYFTFVDQQLPLWFFGLLLARDVLLGIGTYRLHSLGPDTSFEHRYHGKLASTLIFALLVMLTLGASGSLVVPTTILCAAAVVFSTFDYVRRGHTTYAAAAEVARPNQQA